MLVRAPGVPAPLPVRCVDRCELQADGTLLDTIELSAAGVPIGQLVMTLKAAS